MSKALARSELIKTLEPRMAARGFRLVKSQESFRKKQVGIKWTYRLQFLNYVDYKVEPAMSIRIDEVEKVFHRTSGFGKNSTAPTIGKALWSFVKDHKQFVYDLGHIDQAPQIASWIESAFDTVAAPWFGKYSTVAAIDSLLNADPDNPHGDSVYFILSYAQYAHGLIAARLNQRLDYDDLAVTYSKALKRIDEGFYSDRFEALVRDLEDDELIERSRSKLQAQGLLGA